MANGTPRTITRNELMNEWGINPAHVQGSAQHGQTFTQRNEHTTVEVDYNVYNELFTITVWT